MPVAAHSPQHRALDLLVNDRVGVRDGGAYNGNYLRYKRVIAVNSQLRHVQKTVYRPFSVKKYEFVEDERHADGGYFVTCNEMQYEEIDASYEVDEVLYRLEGDRAHTWRRTPAMMPVKLLRSKD